MACNTSLNSDTSRFWGKIREYVLAIASFTVRTSTVASTIPATKAPPIVPGYESRMKRSNTSTVHGSQPQHNIQDNANGKVFTRSGREVKRPDSYSYLTQGEFSHEEQAERGTAERESAVDTATFHTCGVIDTPHPTSHIAGTMTVHPAISSEKLVEMQVGIPLGSEDRTCMALIDSGSNTNYVTKSLWDSCLRGQGVTTSTKSVQVRSTTINGKSLGSMSVGTISLYGIDSVGRRSDIFVADFLIFSQGEKLPCGSDILLASYWINVMSIQICGDPTHGGPTVTFQDGHRVSNDTYLIPPSQYGYCNDRRTYPGVQTQTKYGHYPSTGKTPFSSSERE
jgi:hypothetical protein